MSYIYYPGVDLTTLNTDELYTLIIEAGLDLKFYEESKHALRYQEFQAAVTKNYLQEIKPNMEGNNSIVPLAQDMFVPARMDNPCKVLVDYGNGCFIEQDLAPALDYLKRKEIFYRGEVRKVHKIEIEKSEFKNALLEIYNKKKEEEQQLGIFVPHEFRDEDPVWRNVILDKE